jgi:hypothetical protein
MMIPGTPDRHHNVLKVQDCHFPSLPPKWGFTVDLPVDH